LYDLENEKRYIKKLDTKNMKLLISIFLVNSIINIYLNNKSPYIECGKPYKSTIGLNTEYNGKMINNDILTIELQHIDRYIKTRGVCGIIFKDWKATTMFGYLCYNLFKSRLKFIENETFF
jgi:hypothetical protein